MSLNLSGFDLEKELEVLMCLDIPTNEFMHRCSLLYEKEITLYLEKSVYYVSGIFWKRSYDYFEYLTLDDEKVYKYKLQQKIIPYIDKYFDSIRHKTHKEIIYELNEICEFPKDKVRCFTVAKYLDFIIEKTLFNDEEYILISKSK